MQSDGLFYLLAATETTPSQPVHLRIRLNRNDCKYHEVYTDPFGSNHSDFVQGIHTLEKHHL